MEGKHDSYQPKSFVTMSKTTYSVPRWLWWMMEKETCVITCDSHLWMMHSFFDHV